MAPCGQAARHFPQPLQRLDSIQAASPGSIFMTARVWQMSRASQDSHAWQASQLTNGRNTDHPSGRALPWSEDHDVVRFECPLAEQVHTSDPYAFN
jgi:hypothetical protein